jgi:uncharacterized protein (TIGR03083 family)
VYGTPVTETAGCHRLTDDAYCAAIETEIERIVALAREVDPQAVVPPCPDWTARDLFVHLGGVHRWAEYLVRGTLERPVGPDAVGVDPPGDDALADWLADGGASLVKTLRAADPDGPMWAWGADQHVRFWSRRQLHETAVHRADAELALSRAPVIEAGVAVDGVDEFLENLPCARWAPGLQQLRGDGETIALRSPQTSWLITLEPGGFTWRHTEDATGDATVEGTASELLLFVWGRCSKPAHGDEALLARWVAGSKI